VGGGVGAERINCFGGGAEARIEAAGGGSVRRVAAGCEVVGATVLGDGVSGLAVGVCALPPGVVAEVAVGTVRNVFDPRSGCPGCGS
jgi:hypothetical protein